MRTKPLLIALALASILSACSTVREMHPLQREAVSSQAALRDEKLLAIMLKHDVSTMAAGVIENGELTWSGYYGEQSPGIAATNRSMFNTASVAKALTTETVLRLINKGVLGLDDTLAEYWVDPDLLDDKRHKLLTPRIVLTHRTGFSNWRYMEDDNVLRFHTTPGETFGYSGEGMEYLRRFVEKKTDKRFELWVQELVFDPLDMQDSAVVANERFTAQLVAPRSADGELLEPNINPPGAANAADDFFTTIEDYARLLLSVAGNPGEQNKLDTLKQQIQSDIANDQNFRCVGLNGLECPDAYGFGLGWLIFDYRDHKLVWHGGNDQHEHAVGYIDPVSGNGAIVFANGSTGLMAIIDVLELIDSKAQLADYYRLLLQLH